MLKNIALGRYVYDPKRFKVSQNNNKSYEGYQEETGKLVTIKMARMKPGSCLSMKSVDEESRRQIQAFSKFNHPYFLQAVEITETQNHVFIVSERFKDNLQDRMDICHKPQNAFKIFVDLVIALCVLRSKNYLHLNIVASSIEISEQSIKLSGLNACVHQNQMIGRHKSNSNWRQIAPQLLNQNFVTQKSLIWNLGIILHRLLFRKIPYATINKDEMSSINKIWQTRLEPKADLYLTSILVGCLKISPKERFNLKALLECLLLTDFAKEQYEEIILSRLSLLAQPMEDMGYTQMLSHFWMMKQAENEINYIRILQRTCYLVRKIQCQITAPPLIFLTKYIIQCRLRKLQKLPYWEEENINSQLSKQKQQVLGDESQKNKSQKISPEDSEQYAIFASKDYRYRQITYMHYQAYLRQFILQHLQYLQKIKSKALFAYKYQIYAVDFAISLFSLGQDLITDSMYHKWKFLGSELSKIAEDPLQLSPQEIFQEIRRKVKKLQITD